MPNTLELATALSALQAAPLGIVVIQEQKTIMYANDRANSLLTDGSAKLKGQGLACLPTALTARMFDTQATVNITGWDGKPRWLQCTSQSAGSSKLTIHFMFDVTEQQRLNNECDRLATELARVGTRDNLTSLPNQKAMDQALEPLISRSRRYENPLSVIRVRIADQEGLSAKAGPHAHDSAMVKVAQTLRDQVRWADMVGRYDSSEFLLILPETPEEAARTLVEKLTSKVAEIDLAESGTTKIPCSVRFGAASWQKGDDARLLLNRASTNLGTTSTGAAA